MANNRRYWLLASLVIIISCLSSIPVGAQKTLTILHTNDSH